MTQAQRDELYDGLVTLCQQHGFTTEHTYECLHNAVESIQDDDNEPSELRHVVPIGPVNLIWIDTTSGTWGPVDHGNGRLVLVDVNTVIDESMVDVQSVYAALDSMSDSEIAEFGNRYGKQPTVVT